MSSDEETREQQHRVVIIGSGFGAMFAAEKLKHAPVHVTLISEVSYHLFQPLLYQVATGILSVGEIAVPSRVILRKQKNTRVLLATVTDVDVDRRCVIADQFGLEVTTPYDSLIVAAGATQSYFGNDRFSEFAPGMKTIDNALELRSRILYAFERAEVTTDPDELARLLTFVVVGAGPTGVEMVGQIAELATSTLRGTFRHVDPSIARVILVDAAPQVLPPLGPELGAKAQAKLEKLGVEVLLDAMVTDVDEAGLVLKTDAGEQRIESFCKIWAAGVSASSLGGVLADQTGTELDRAGRVRVNPDLSIRDHPEVFVVGDMMALSDVPGIAPAAIQSGQYAAKTIRREAEAARDGRDAPPRTPFKYLDKGSISVVAKYNAVGKVIGGRFAVSGAIGWFMWLAIHLFYLVGFKNRYTTLLSWLFTFMSNSRSQLTMTAQWLVARTALGGVTASRESAQPPRLRQVE